MVKIAFGWSRFSGMEIGAFEGKPKNPLTELSELRLEVLPGDDLFSVKCLLKLGVMHLEHGGNQFDIGASRTVLRLWLEGCETEIGSNFAEHSLPAVEETNTAIDSKSAKANLKIMTLGSKGTHCDAAGELGVGGSVTNERTQSQINFPVRGLPGDAWEVRAQSVGKGAGSMIQGTAIRGERLCILRRVSGGNRMALTAELQVRKSDLEVTQHGGNKLGRAFGSRHNRDALIGIIVGRAMEREVAISGGLPQPETIVVSKCEMNET